MTTTLGGRRARVRERAEEPLPNRLLGHPLAFCATAAILIALFGWTFFTNPGRPAPADDPAFYAWRTEALISDVPATLLEVEGPQQMLVGGYRVVTPVIAGFMRHVASVGPLTPTVWLAVGLRVVVPLLLAGFAYRHRRDPLIFHAVAFGSASLLPTPPFGGYLDNVLTLTFLSCALYLLQPAARSWPARIGLFLLLLAAGLAHPTTLVIFCGVLGAMSAVRLVVRRFDLPSVIRDDGAMLAVAFVAVVALYAVWKVGIWGPSAALGEAAVPPPADSSFFLKRMSGWLRALRPTFNLPLLLLGVAGLLATGKRAIDDELTRPALVWLLPLVGALGFVLGVAYPYYRFLNTTVAWLLLVGVGVFFAARWFIATAGRGGIYRLALLGLAVPVVIVATNFSTGFAQVSWNDIEQAWISPDEIDELNLVRAHLEGEEDRSVVFVTDTEAPEAVRAYGWLKLVANVSRFGVALGQHDRAHVYLGPLDSYLAGEPSSGPAPNFEELSQASLEDAERMISGGAPEPVVVVSRAFNLEGRNTDLAAGTDVPASENAEILVVSQQGLFDSTGPVAPPDVPAAGVMHLAPVLVGLIALLIPGYLMARWVLPGSSFAELLGLVPAFSLVALGLAGAAALAVVRIPFSSLYAWAVVGVLCAVLAPAARRRS
ncbi:MAG: hypothetical protein M3454_15095 [Actinomycetota bacterium]|nr:hypothetical protein [Actinomycetota bacterium]